MNLDCRELKQKYESLKEKRENFLALLVQKDKPYNLGELKHLKKELEKSRDEMLDMLVVSKYELKKFYQENINVLSETGLIERLPDGQMGFYDISGKERPIPKYEEFIGYFTEKYSERKEFFDRKKEQGFTEIRFIPFGMPLKQFKVCAEELLRKKYKEGKLMGTDGTKLELDEEEPVWMANEYECKDNEQGADVTGNLIYYPKKYDPENHGGKTKQEILDEKDKKNKFAGWEIQFVEDLPDLPAAGKGKKVGGRNQVKTNFSPDHYLKILETEKQYEGEQGQTPEAELTEFIYNIKVYNRVIDDWQGKGKGCWNICGYFISGLVCDSIWYQDLGRMNFGRNNPYGRNDLYGCRFGVSLR